MNRLLLLAPRIATNRLWARAGEVPSFHIAPARTQNARDLITGSVLGTYNSASPALAVGPDGVLFQPAANAPVIEYDPVTLACLGARIWGAVTNQIRNNTNVGAVVGTPGTLPTNWSAATPSNGLSRQIVGIGTVNGVDYVDIRYFGTTTAASSTNIQFESQTAVTAASGETWTASLYLAIVGGSLSNINTPARLRVTGRNTTGTLQETQQTDNTVDSSFVRKSATATFSNVNTARVSVEFIFTYNSGVAIDVTYRLGLPQLEKSATMGPVVKTSGLAASSTADAWSITGADLTRIYNPSETTIFLDALDFASSGRIYFDDGAGINERFDLRFNNSNWGMFSIGGGGSANSGNNNPTARIAGTIAADGLAVSVNGAAVVTGALITMPQNISQMWIGSRRGISSFANGYIRELAIFRSRRPNANLQAMTS